MARSYKRDTIGRFATTGGGGGRASTSTATKGTKKVQGKSRVTTASSLKLGDKIPSKSKWNASSGSGFDNQGVISKIERFTSSSGKKFTRVTTDGSMIQTFQDGQKVSVSTTPSVAKSTGKKLKK